MSQVSQVKAEAGADSSAAPSPASTIDSKAASYAEYQLFSSPDQAHRFNIMKMNSSKPTDPSRFPQPIKMTRKDPHGGLDDRFAYDDAGNVLGRYDFDENGKPVLGADGKQTYTPDRVEADQSLVAPGENGKPAKKRYQKSTKEIHQVDKEVMRFKREEAQPWVLEAGVQSNAQAEKWVGRIQDTSEQAYVLFVLDEGSESFRVLPVGRKYKFEPNRTFGILDADQADAAYQRSMKNKSRDLWSQRDAIAGPSGVKSEPGRRKGVPDREMKIERDFMVRRGLALPQDARSTRVKREVKERWDDDVKMERRDGARGIEGGLDEELDFDANEHFQDDEERVDLDRDEDDVAEAKALEERQKREFRMANAGLGIRPSGAGSDSDSDDLFGEKEAKLTKEGKAMRRKLRKYANDDDGLDGRYMRNSDSVSASERDVLIIKESSSDESVEDKKPDEKDKAKALQESGKSGSVSPRPNANGSRGGSPGAGAALLAQRAASPHGKRSGSRAGSPLAPGAKKSRRTDSPELDGRGSPSAPASRAGSPALGVPPHMNQKKRKTTESPGPGTPSGDGGERKKSKNGRAGATPTPQPEEIEDFTGKLTERQVIEYLRKNQVQVPILVKHFRTQVSKDARNRTVLMSMIKKFAELVDGVVILREQYRS